MAELTISNRRLEKTPKGIVEIIDAAFATTETSGSLTLSGNLKQIASHCIHGFGPETLYLDEAANVKGGRIQVASNHVAVVRSAGTTSGLKFQLRLEGP